MLRINADAAIFTQGVKDPYAAVFFLVYPLSQ